MGSAARMCQPRCRSCTCLAPLLRRGRREESYPLWEGRTIVLSARGLEEAACDREGVGSRAAVDHTNPLGHWTLDGPHDCPGEGGGPGGSKVWGCPLSPGGAVGSLAQGQRLLRSHPPPQARQLGSQCQLVGKSLHMEACGCQRVWACLVLPTKTLKDDSLSHLARVRRVPAFSVPTPQGHRARHHNADLCSTRTPTCSINNQVLLDKLTDGIDCRKENLLQVPKCSSSQPL